MSLAFKILIVLIVAVPVLSFVSSGAAMSAQILIASLGLLCVATAARAGDAVHFSRATSGLVWAFAVAPILIILQLLPLPLTLSHPIWASAADALQSKTFGHISVDLGATFGALFAALSAMAMAGLAIIVARDRRRAELILLTAGAVTTLTAAMILIQAVFPFMAPSGEQAALARGLCGLGVILNLAIILLAFERRETRNQRAFRFMVAGFVGLIGAAINLSALLAAGGPQAAASVAFGVTLLVLIVVIRRLDLSRWPTAILALSTLAGAAIMVTFMAEKNPEAGGLLRFIPAQSPEIAAVITRILGDGRWLGSGAGGFSALSRIYQIGDDQSLIVAPTTAVSWVVEIGWIGLAAVVLTGLALAAKLVGGALQRGRDSFFPGAAAACLISALCEIFLGSGLLNPSVAILLAVTTGLGLSQVFSQSARQ